MSALNAALRRWRSEAGAELIELMLVIPIFLMVCAGIVDFGLLFRSWETVSNAAREGARVAALPSYSDAGVTDRVDHYMAAAGFTQPYTVTVSTQTLTTGGSTYTARGANVGLTHDFVILGGVAGFFGGSFGSIPIAASVVMRLEAEAATGP